MKEKSPRPDQGTSVQKQGGQDAQTPGQVRPEGTRSSSEYVQPHTLGAHLPTPGEMPGWPFHNNGQWRVDIRGSAEHWRRGLKAWRKEHLIRIGYDGSQYERKELMWAQCNFVHTQMMVEDRYFYDPDTLKYTVDRYLDDLERRYGGIDSVLIWYVYPNIGIDDRNQTDLAQDLPGGLQGLKQAISDFHDRGVRVFLPTMPWDNGTRDAGIPDWQAIAELAAEVKADGVNGDTYYGVPYAFREASDKTGHAVVFQPETWTVGDEALKWNNQSWGKSSREVVPAASKLKWLEPRHMINVENRWARNRTDDFHYIFFNGIGYVAWENVWGIWNQFTPRDAEILRRIATIQRKFAHLLTSADWEPYADTLQQGVFASRFPEKELALWTIVNRNEYDVDGDELVVRHVDGVRYYDVWNGVELQARVVGDDAYLRLYLEAHGLGAVLAVEPDAQVEELNEFLERMHALAGVPLQSLSGSWQPMPQKLVPITATRIVLGAPSDMVAIPPGEFDFVVSGIEIEGYTSVGLDFQYPWESSARRSHRHRLEMQAFYIDRYPVTNAEFRRFIDATEYHPADDHNFLRDWVNGRPRQGWENKPVTWVSIEDARAYAEWAGKRLPHEWEWQYAAQGTDGRLYPWGNEWNPAAVPAANEGRRLLPPADVDAHPLGASPYGVLDLVANVWQWTDEFVDEHTRAAVLRGGSSYRPRTSHWYFPQAYRLDQHGKYLLMAPCKDRSGMLGFRCVLDRNA